MSHSEYNLPEHADAYVHGLLDEAEAAQFKRACEESEEHRTALSDAELRLQSLHSLPPIEASEELIQATLEKAVGPPAVVFNGFLKKFWISCAVAAALAAVIHLYVLSMAPSSMNLVVLGQTVLRPDTAASLRVRLTNHNNHQPLADVPVWISLINKETHETANLAHFETDAAGTGEPRFSVPDWPEGDYELLVSAKTGWRGELLRKTISLRREWKLMLSTDKPVYQPGQTIRLRSLSLRKPDLKPEAGKPVTFKLTDPNGNVLFKAETTTSRFGIAATDCPLAEEIQHGAYIITCTVDHTESQQTVEIKPYVLPKFKLGLQTEQAYYKPGELVRINVSAHYFFGKPVAQADVTLLVQTTEVEPRSMTRLKVKTNEAGEAALQFRLPEQLYGTGRLAGDAELSLELTVKDSGGQQEQRVQNLLVTSRPLRVEVIPENGDMVAGLPNTIYVYTSYADGRPAKTRIRISGRTEELETSALGVATFQQQLNELPEDGYLTFVATDEAGTRGQERVQLWLPNRPGDYAHGYVLGNFILRTDKAVYDGGDTAYLRLLGGGNDPIFVDVLKDRQTLLTQTVTMKNSRGDLVLDLSPELSGTLQICAYRLQANGIPLRKTRVIYVRPAQQLTVETKLDRAAYRPGERAKLRFKLTDEQGAPRPGALSLAAVDEAVYSVLPRRPGLENTFFQLDQQLLQPVYEIYNWQPGQAGRPLDPGRNELEKALFIRASQSASERSDQLNWIIAQYAENSFELLDVLEREDWEVLAADMGIPERTISLLKGDNSPHTLSQATFPQKEVEIEATRRRWNALMKGAWIIIGIAAGICGLVTLCRVADGCGTVVVLGMIILLLISLLMPALQRAREASRRSMAMSDLRNLDMAVAAQDQYGPRESQQSETAAEPRVREWFPETLLWRPELITNDQGEATLEIDLADSITTWKLGVSAVSADGSLGGSEASIKVFQPFFVDLNLPVALTRGDEVALPVVVYNYLDEPQQVRLKLETASWFEMLDEAEQTVELAPQEVRSVAYRIKAKEVGQHALQVTALGSDVSDAIRRTLEVVPDGQPVEQVQSGNLAQPVIFETGVPDNAIAGSVRTLVTIYPSSFSQVVEGLDAIFQRPYGCFEQTSSTTYPNILALNYLRQTKQSLPEVEAKASQYIHLGYQRLVSFEVSGGGFDWFGSPPANRTLTAYGLMEFEDMSRVHAVDPELIRRTRHWLLEQQRPDGSWLPESHRWHEDPALRGGAGLLRLTTTAYIAWAVYSDPHTTSNRELTLQYLLRHSPDSIDSPYALALVAQAVSVMDQSGTQAKPYLKQLLKLKSVDPQGKFSWWEPQADAQTIFYGAGRSGQIETTALALLALQQANTAPETIRQGLSWLITQKDAQGTWYSTSATVLALKALLSGAGKPLGGERARTIAIEIDGKPYQQITIPADQSEVTRQIDLTSLTGQGNHQLRLQDESGTDAGYQMLFRYYVPESQEKERHEPLTIKVTYNRSELDSGETVHATADITNNLSTAAPMVLMDLPVPAGFAIETQELEAAVEKGQIAKYQHTPRSLVVYLRELASAQTLTLHYRLRATMPIQTQVRPAVAYHYYDPDQRGVGSWAQLKVSSNTASMK